MPINIFVNEIFQLEPSVVQDRFNSINNVNSVIYVNNVKNINKSARLGKGGKSAKLAHHQFLALFLQLLKEHFLSVSAGLQLYKGRVQ